MSDAKPTLVVGLGVTNRAVIAALIHHGHPSSLLIALDDRPTEAIRSFAAAHEVDLIEAPAPEAVSDLVAGAEVVIPAPGLPDRHPAMRAAHDHQVRVVSEFDLAAEWDDRPLIAVTGSDGKTTVTTMVAEMLNRSGQRVELAGNNDTPLVEAIAQPEPEAFVVEASSFRIGHSERFAPSVATWLNFAPDHLDVHASLAAYEAAKAKIFTHQTATSTAITNADDPVVSRYRQAGGGRHITFSADRGDYRVEAGVLLTDRDEPLLAVADLQRQAPHDIANALAAAATARSAGAEIEAIAEVLSTFRGLAHRAQLIAEHNGIRFVDDSKATVPHAVLAAVRAEQRVVLIAGGRNKGLDLTPLAEVAERVATVVAIGEAAGEIRAAFEPMRVPVHDATSMGQAVELAMSLARSGDTVLLSPGCASHDWYANFAERGEDFTRIVHDLNTRTETS